MVNAKQKGSRGERELAEWLRENGCASARRTQQYCGTEGTSDITVSELSEWHIEHKATKSAKIAPSMLKSWFKQVRTDCPEGKLPVIINTPNGRERVAILPLVSINRLSRYSNILNYTHSIYIDTISGTAFDLEGMLRTQMNEYACRHGIGQINTSPIPALMGNVLLSEKDKEDFAEHFMVFTAEVWLEFAKQFQVDSSVTAAAFAQIDAVQKSSES